MSWVAGHIDHIWESSDLTFRQLEDIIYKSLHGNLVNLQEKLDGINILITYKDKKILMARFPEHLKNYGENALDVNGILDSSIFIKKIFIDVVDHFTMTSILSELDFKKIFKEGKVWLSAEILSIENENVIPYFKNQICVHQLREIDENGKVIKIINEKKLDELISDIKISQDSFIDFVLYPIVKTNKVTVGKIENLELLENRLTNELRALMISADLTTKNTIKDYYKIKKENKSFIDLFTDLGIIVLQNIEGLATSNPKKSLEKLKIKFYKTYNYLGQNLHNNDIELSMKAEEILVHYERLDRIGGITSLVPIEGIVFEYKDKLLKLTGSFIPLLKMNNFYRFGINAH
jgi:flagellar biosynthesis regulator FlaF